MVLALENGSGCGFLTPMSYESQSDSHRPPPRGVAPGHATLDGSFHCTPDVTHVDIRQAHFDAVAHGIAAERIDRVEAHRLIVEERDVILDGVIVPEPGRLIREQSKRGGMRLGEPELAEGDHLAEHFLRRDFRDTAGEGAGAKLLPEPGHQIVRPAAAHRAP